MMQLYPILLVAIVLVADRGFVVPPDTPGLARLATPVGALLAATVPVAVVLAVTALGLRRCDRRLARGKTARALVSADRYAHAARIALLVSHAFAVLVAGWLQAVRDVVGDPVLIDEVVAIMPPVFGVAGVWWLYYPIERRLREAVLMRRLDEGASVHPMPSRGRYVVQQARLHLLLLLVPVLTIVGLSELIEWAAARAEGAVPAWTSELATIAAGVTVFILAPFLARLVLSVERLGDGPVHDDLAAICARHGIRVRAFLLWRTDGTMINAAVMGIIGPVRYVLLTDALIESLDRGQVRAVMAHEIGHVKRHHMTWLVLSLLAMLLLASFTVSVPLIFIEELDLLGASTHAAWTDGVASALAGTAALLAFGWISRRYERQADTFAVQHLSGLGTPGPDGAAQPVTAEAVDTMRGALGAVASLNAVARHRRSWRHGSIAWRQAYLSSLLGRPLDALPIDRLISRVKLGVLAILVLGSAGMVLLGVAGKHAIAAEAAGAPAEVAGPGTVFGGGAR